ncbi:MAG: ribonuclease III [Sphaerospermopsis sp. SIO1G2]|nr:ribonuclease III [Sphaerospermopsis sp. SIO1G1]NET71737.1 ribonuclease III [Sphaerospermopsis sp. SIO1G2]
MNPKEEEAKNVEDETAIQNSSDIPEFLVNLNQAPLYLSEAQVKEISPSALAYLGDAIYELYVRMFFLWPKQRPEIYHRLVVAQVRAETQALHLRSLTPHLRSYELDMIRRGRNAATGRPKRLNPEIYQQATGLETLVGYLYLTDYPRLQELLQKLHLEK